MLGFDLMKFLRFSVLGVRGAGAAEEGLEASEVRGLGGGGGGGQMVPLTTRAAVLSDIRGFSLLLLSSNPRSRVRFRSASSTRCALLCAAMASLSASATFSLSALVEDEEGGEEVDSLETGMV